METRIHHHHHHLLEHHVLTVQEEQPSLHEMTTMQENSEMKTGILQLLYASPFAGLDHEDPYTHLTKFYEIAGAVGAPEREEEQVFKRLFPHSLIGKAKDWYLDQPTQTMTNWNELEEKFLDRFFPQSRLLEAKTAISVFSQGVNETLNEASVVVVSHYEKCESG